MSQLYQPREKLAGLLLILGFAIAVVAVILVGGGRNWFRSYNHYYALYPEGYNISPGVKVKFLRTDIGYVTKLELTEDNQVKVTMKILSSFASRIRQDSIAAVESPTIIGSEYIDIIPSPTGDAPLILPDGEITARRKKNLNDMLADLKLEEKLQIVEDIMRNVERLTAQLQDPQGPFLGTMSNVRTVTGQVARGEGSLGSIVAKDELYHKIQAILATIEKSSRELALVTAELNRAAPGLIKKIDTIAARLEQASRNAPEIGREAREGLRDVNQILDSAKKNFLIRGHLPQRQEPDSLGLSIQGR